MSASKIINPVADQEKKNALAQPHNLFVVDELLKVEMDSYTGTISLGMRSPAGNIGPAFTVKMPMPFMIDLAKLILEEAQNKKEQFKTEHTAFYKSL